MLFISFPAILAESPPSRMAPPQLLPSAACGNRIERVGTGHDEQEEERAQEKLPLNQQPEAELRQHFSHSMLIGQVKLSASMLVWPACHCAFCVFVSLSDRRHNALSGILSACPASERVALHRAASFHAFWRDAFQCAAARACGSAAGTGAAVLSPLVRCCRRSTKKTELIRMVVVTVRSSTHR